ncbi:Spindle pole body component 97 [Glycine max]|nr:Spindle pole body component 97 [Glycine max]
MTPLSPMMTMSSSSTTPTPAPFSQRHTTTFHLLPLHIAIEGKLLYMSSSMGLDGFLFGGIQNMGGAGYNMGGVGRKCWGTIQIGPCAAQLIRVSSRADSVVRGVLRMLQGFSGPPFFWDKNANIFRAKSGVYVSHLSQKSLHSLLNQFIHAATCLQLVAITLNKVETAVPKSPPTLNAFVCLKGLRNIALKEETSTSNADCVTTPTLLGLANSLSSLCSGAEFLFGVVHEAIPAVYFEFGLSVPAAELTVHVLDYLHKKLDEMVLYMYVGSLLPYIEGLDSWLFEGILDDPFGEMSFFTDKEVSVDEAEFWEKSYLLRRLQHSKLDSEFFSSTNYVNDPVPASNDKEMDRRIPSLCLVQLKEKSRAFEIVQPGLRKAIFGGENAAFSDSEGMNYTFGFHFGESEYLRSQDDRKLLEMLFPFPTILPLFQDDLPVSELLPFQRNSSLISRVLHWMQNVDLRTTPLPLVIMQYCLTVYIQKQESLYGFVFYTIYAYQLQESIRNSADCMLLSAPDSLVVSITKNHVDSDEEASTAGVVLSTPPQSHVNSFGINGLDMLKFTYRVPWPLELIANTEAIKKYNQVMRFLLKVKRAKFVLDKVRRWMWKGKGSATNNRKHHWLVEQKLLHFVDAFHQYVMDRVCTLEPEHFYLLLQFLWRELCEGMTAAKSLDEVIEVHEAYILSIQRQCFVVPDKLGALIASRINSILGIALDFYNIQQTLGSGGAVSAIKARCEMEVDRIDNSLMIALLSY